MAQYSIYHAKARFSELLRVVKTGKEVIINERGIPIAKVIPFGNESFSHRIRAMEGSGNLLRREKPKSLPMGIRRTGALKRFLKERD